MSDESLDHIPPENLRLCLSVAHKECDVLRFILAWCGRRLSRQDRLEVARMVREKVVKDGREEEREALAEAHKMLVKFADLVREVIEGPTPEDWYMRADTLAEHAMEFDPPTEAATLVELRNLKEFADGFFDERRSA